MFVIIIGGGRTGSQLTHMLREQGHTVRLIEDRPSLLPRLHREHPTEIIVDGDPANPEVLKQAGLDEAQVLAACHSDDTINLAVCFMAREIFKTRRIIARVNNPRNAWLFNETFHIDSALNASNIFAGLIQEEMSLGDMVTLLKLRRGRYSLVEEKVPAGAGGIHIPIKELGLPRSCVIAAIIRSGEVCIPTGDTVFEPGDEVLAVTNEEGARQLAQLFAVPSA
ncbi:MAG: TrkA family potassium uptake protein [Anaerolineales bacterium]